MNKQEYDYLVGVTIEDCCDTDDEKCVCSGCGWFLTDFDIFEKCPLHYKNSKDTPHPEFYIDNINN